MHHILSIILPLAVLEVLVGVAAVACRSVILTRRPHHTGYRRKASLVDVEKFEKLDRILGY